MASLAMDNITLSPNLTKHHSCDVVDIIVTCELLNISKCGLFY